MNKLKRDFALGYVVGFNSAPVTETGYKPDADWLPLPFALDGQITALVNDVAPMQFYLNSIDGGICSCTVNWGDGNVETYTTITAISETPTHTYVTGGHLIANGTKQYIITISNIVNATIKQIYNTNLGGVLLASVNCDISKFDSMFKNSFELCQVDVLTGTEIPRSFCAFCQSLKKVKLCNTISIINKIAFNSCYAFEEINLGDCNITLIDSADSSDSPFLNCNIKIVDLSKSSLTEIKPCTFNTMRCLVTVMLPATVANIGESAFAYDHSLSNINIPSGCVIGQYAFDQCRSLHPTPV